MRRSEICLYLGPADRAELQALITNRNTARKLFWRAEIVLATADGNGTFEIMRRAQHNEAPKLFRWTKSAEDILARERRAPSMKSAETGRKRRTQSNREITLLYLSRNIYVPILWQVCE